MHDLWARFENWLSEHWPEGLAGLNPPATEQQIADLQAALGVSLPEDYVMCLKIHNGQAANVGGMFDGAEFLSTDAVLEQWTVWKGLLDGGEFADIESSPLNAGIRSDWWNARWIPFTHNGCGDHLCLDLAPATSGTPGQVITMWHDAAEPELLSPSFGSWFKSYMKLVFSGEMMYSEEYDGLINRADAEAS